MIPIFNSTQEALEYGKLCKGNIIKQKELKRAYALYYLNNQKEINIKDVFQAQFCREALEQSEIK